MVKNIIKILSVLIILYVILLNYIKSDLYFIDLSQKVLKEFKELIFRQLDKDYWVVNEPNQRKNYPLYSVIPAANDDELTLSLSSPKKDDFISWNRSHQDNSSLRFSALDRINNLNVNKLKLAWTYHSGDLPVDRSKLEFGDTVQANPIVVNGIIYAPTIGNHVVAINATNGKEIWRYKSLSRKPAHRGLVYVDSENSSSKIGRIFFTSGKSLISLNADTGAIDKSFGNDGIVKLTSISKTTPVIFENQVVILDFKPSIKSYDLTTGELLWKYSLNVKSQNRSGGKKNIVSGGNPWSGVSLDKDRGIIFFGRGNPRPDFVGIQRPGDNNYSNSVVAFSLTERKILWNFQEIRHDIWDLDVSSYPMLVSITRGGRKVDVVVTLTKLGNTLILDRLSGKPIFDFRMRRAKSSTLPGEKTSLYQPDLVLPQPFSKQEFTSDDVTNIGGKNTQSVISQVSQATFGWFEPFSFKATSGESNDLILFGVHGGASWPGASIDPFREIIYISSNDFPWKITLKRELRSIFSRVILNAKLQSLPNYPLYSELCSSCHGRNLEGVINDSVSAPNISKAFEKYSKESLNGIVTNGYKGMPGFSGLSDYKINKISDYILTAGELIASQELPNSKPWDYDYFKKSLSRFTDYEGFPASKPPWGKLTALDLNTGLILWSVPLGEYEELKRRNIPITGTENYGGTTATSGGVIFVAGTLDKKIRAFDASNGNELWSFKMPYAGFSPPTVYEVDNEEYVLIPASGGGVAFNSFPEIAKHGDAFLSFKLSD